MRKDICHYYNAGLKEVFNAYLSAINAKFGKSCKTAGLVRIEFGLNASFRYNMNGGACTVHFMPYNSGVAVNVRYTIIQMMGARCGAHDRDMTAAVEKALGVRAQDINIDVGAFVSYAQNHSADPAPASAPVDVPAAIREYKKLLDEGIITQEEYDAKKKQLLGL